MCALTSALSAAAGKGAPQMGQALRASGGGLGGGACCRGGGGAGCIGAPGS